MSFVRSIYASIPPWLRALVSHARSGALLSPHARASFSQEGEDLLLVRLFQGRKSGFYVDVGAHHPTRFSNTHLLHRMGWHGVNIDAMPGSMAAFDRARPNDVNLEVAVSSDASKQHLYLFDDPALNSLSNELSVTQDREGTYSIRDQVQVVTLPLRDILERYGPPDGHAIDLMTIDVEGHDFEVLKSNDWSRFRPRVLLIEVLNCSIQDLGGRPEISFLQDRGYVIHSKLVHTVVLTEGGS